MQIQDRQHLRHNFVVNVSDGAFFGFAVGVASFVTIIPLFVATLTDSTVLIGLIASIHTVGWQLPQLLTANRVAKLHQYRRMVLLMTLHERWPFLGLAVVAALTPIIGSGVALALTFILVTWQGLGGGFTATAWQTMIAKIMPSNIRGTFYGTQSAFANLLSSGGAVLAGVLLSSFGSHTGFTVCFLLAGIAMLLSMGFLAMTRESETPVVQETAQTRRDYWKALQNILRTDVNFRWFVAVRMLAQSAGVGLAFYTIYAVRRFGMSEETAGIMTGVLLLSQTIANPVLGWLGDRWNHRIMFALGALLAMIAAILAAVVTNLNWFYLIFTLAGVAQAALWTTTIVLTSEFGTDKERPYYIGLANTLVAPVTLFTPLIGGWLADAISFEATFLLAAGSGLAAAVLVLFALRSPAIADTFQPIAADVITTPSNV